MKKIEHPYSCIGSNTRVLDVFLPVLGTQSDFGDAESAFLGSQIFNFFRGLVDICQYFACIWTPPRIYHFGIDLTNILSSIINIIPDLMPSFWITSFYWVLILNSNHYKPKMEGCDVKQNATFTYVFFFPRMNRFVPPTIPPANIVFRMKRLFSIDMAYFSPSISVILHAIPLLWILKWYNTLHQWMNILHSWMNIPFLLQCDYIIFVLPSFPPLFSRSPLKTWTSVASNCCSC